MAAIGIRSGDLIEVTVVDENRNWTQQFPAQFESLETGRDGCTPEALIVRSEGRSYRCPLAVTLVRKLSRAPRSEVT